MQENNEMVIRALTYAYDNFLSRKYNQVTINGKQPIITYAPDSKNFELHANHSEFNKSENQLVVYRCNHGLSHTTRTLILIPDVINFNQKYAIESVKKYLATQESVLFLRKMQIAMAFYVTGRESEEGFSPKPNSAYSQFRKQSAQNFKNFLLNNPDIAELYGANEIETIADCLKDTYLPDNNLEVTQPSVIAIKAILYGAHCADLTRCKSAQDISSNDLLKVVPEEKKLRPDIIHEASKIFGKASAMSQTMGNPIVSYYDISEKVFKNVTQIKCPKLYSNNDFIKYETSLNDCVVFMNQMKAFSKKPSFFEPPLIPRLKNKEYELSKTKYSILVIFSNEKDAQKFFDFYKNSIYPLWDKRLNNYLPVLDNQRITDKFVIRIPISISIPENPNDPYTFEKFCNDTNLNFPDVQDIKNEIRDYKPADNSSCSLEINIV